ncbi:MAG: SDR family oxidoreductase [Planctomycetota bacterium]|jgi:3-oxoacyl-[acyl-carrier protein] reductase|nr:SDR family oxidoreductase [Planctomycetota bacterium]MDP6763022.1 SDR family oxidoreductase [Planctomycetota bacterium]MDP6988193.1 SDR family oxidoreductase [Planctomycetota bacterium]
MSPLRVLVTGGGRGIGRAIALRFAREGARVVVAARTSTELDEVVAAIGAAGGQGLAAQMNVRDRGSVEAAVWRCNQFTGEALDVVVNNAGVFDVAPVTEVDDETWERNMEVNLRGAWYVTTEVLDALSEGERPHVFNMASIAAREGFAHTTAYCASKYGLRGFSDALREELSEQGIRVSTVYPGPTDTTIFDGVPGDWDRSAMNAPEDVAEVIWDAYNAGEGIDVADLDVPPPA